ncbi:hypothetical protein FACS1894211_00430 [Clostridia bacterium]|nr:hypothetical protein FACS1894211_00430 [Clostridia bacterium]
MKKPTVKFNSRGETGNIYSILAMTRLAILRQEKQRVLDDCALATFEDNGYGKETAAFLKKHENYSAQALAEFDAMCKRVYDSGSYEDALRIIREKVTLKDLDGRY